jgi:hypothetical protein
LLVAILISCASVAAMAENIDPAADGSQYAWGENVGWLNAEPQGEGGPGMTVSDSELTGWVWGENIGWISLSCQNTSSCGDNAYEVVNDGCGSLTGYAWGENVGWISFSCLNSASCVTADYGVTIDPQTGDFSGRAWGENVGWITFASSGATPYKVATSWNPAQSTGSATFTMDIVGFDLVLTWTGLPSADFYQGLQGSLSDLRSSGGDFTSALILCVGNAGETSIVLPLDRTTDADFYLVRGVNCGGKGSVEGSGSNQVGLRDGEIASSPNDCP